MLNQTSQKVRAMDSRARVITVTPAPSIDRTYVVDVLELGGVHRASSATADFAGKGVNVTQALTLAGVASEAIVPLTPEDAAHYCSEPAIRASLSSQTVRHNITVIEPGGRTTKVNAVAPELTAPEWHALHSEAISRLHTHHSEWLLVAGTLPAGQSELAQALMREASSAGFLVALDTSGDALIESARSGVPDFVKPNAAELAECVGFTLATIGDVLRAARELISWGIKNVAVSLGPDGIVGASESHAIHAWTEPLVVRNTIGAGDASVAGFLSHQVHSPGDLPGAIRQAVQWGAQKVQQPGSQLEHFDSLPKVLSSVEPDLDRRLAEPGII